MRVRRTRNGMPIEVARLLADLDSDEVQQTSPGPGFGVALVATDSDGRLDATLMPEALEDHMSEPDLDVLHLAAAGTSFVSGASDGKLQRRTDHDLLYGRDGGRSRWYANPFNRDFAAIGSVGGATYLRGPSGMVGSSTAGPRVPFNLVLLGIAWQMSAASVGNWEVHRGGSSVYSVSHNAASAVITSLDVDILGGSVPLAVYNSAGTVTNATVTLILARTDT